MDVRKQEYTKDELEEMNKNRTSKNKIDVENVSILQTLNNELKTVDQNLNQLSDSPQSPVVFIVGAPRSGSSLVYQLVAGSQAFGYISNFTARFWKAPYTGALLEKAMGIRENIDDISFDSFYGKMKDSLYSPHECQYFWDRWFAQGQETQDLKPSELENIDKLELNKAIAGVEEAWDKPTLFKSCFWFSHQIDFLSKTFPNSIFIVTERNPLYIAQSIVKGRIELQNDKHEWWSIKPRNYEEIKNETWDRQVIGQVYYTLQAINESVAKLPKDRVVFANYYKVCEDPSSFLKELEIKVNNKGGNIKIPESYYDTFKPADKMKIDEDDFSSLVNAYQDFFGQGPVV